MNILEVIKNDHDRVRALLTRLINNEESAPEKRSDIIQRIRDEVIPHARAEETVLYNGMRTADGPTDLVYHGFKEHAEIDVLLRALEAVDNYHTKGWKMLAEKLQEELVHHMAEEESDLFPEVRATFDDKQLEEMAIRFKELKPQIREQGVMQNSLDFVANLIPPHIIEQIKERVPEVLSSKLK